MTPRTELYEFLLDALDRCNERQDYGLPKRPGDLAGMLADELLAAGSPVVSSSLDVELLEKATRAGLPARLEAAAVTEQWDAADNMCPNCVTPWKCNGPHLWEQTKAAKRAASQASDTGLRANVDDGVLEYERETRTLIYTERLGPDEYGAVEVVASGVSAWFGERVAHAFRSLSDALTAISRHESATEDGAWRDFDVAGFARYHRSLPHDDGVPRSACNECRLLDHIDRLTPTPDDRDREVERIAAMGKALIDLTSAYHHERRHEGRWDACQRPRCQNARLAMQNRGPFADAGLRASGGTA